MAHSKRPYLNLSVHIANRKREVAGKLVWDDRFTDLDEYRRIARAAHDARIDALFMADHPVLYRDVAKAPMHTLDPLLILTALLTEFPGIGGIYTASTTLEYPYNLARRLQSLNWLTHGRIAWNVVATWNPAVVGNFADTGLADHAARYAQAHEATTVIRRLWESWDHLSEPETGLRGTPIDHEGRFFSITGPLIVPNAPWGPPLICQAGASPQGVDLGGAHADLIYASVQSKRGSVRYRNELEAAARLHGRTDPQIRILPGLRIITASTSDEVRRKLEAEEDSLPEATRAVKLAEQLSLSLDGLDWDQPLDPAALRPGGNLPQGFFVAMLDLVEEEGLSFRQLLARRADGHRFVAGTPDVIADDIEDWWRSGAVDGFTLTPHSIGDDLDLLLGEVVPILQKRGLYPTEYEESTLRARFAV